MAEKVLMKAGLKKVGQRIYNYIDTRVPLPNKLMDYETYTALTDEERLLDILYIVTNTPIVKDKPVSSIPPKTVISIAGTEDDVPDGWAICDGQNGTPDLRGRFVLGSDGSGEDAQYPQNTTGGTDFIEVNIEDVNGVAVTSDHSGGSLFNGGENAVVPVENETENYGISTQAESAEDEDTSAIILHMPPYYALLYIMKLDDEASPASETDAETGTVLFYKNQQIIGSGTVDRAGDGIVIEDNRISVAKPVRGFYTKEEYEALPESIRNTGILIFDDGEEDEPSITMDQVETAIDTAIQAAITSVVEGEY